MYSKKFILAVLMVGYTCLMHAQTNKEGITVTNGQGKEEVIELPQGMEADVDSMLDLYNTKAYLRPDTNCNMPDVNPVYDKEVYKERLSKLPTIIEMPYNDVVQKFIDRYSNKLRRKVSIIIGSSNFYIPIFEEALEAYNLPLELKYLPVIESGLNPNATSRVGAAGLWQFMISTGKRYGLQVNSLVDERRDIVKSTYAAAKYISDLYKIFGDWNLVIAAYNCGPDKVNKAIHRSKGERDYWQIYPYLPKETQGYVPAFIAANYIMNYYCEHNICPMITQLPEKTDTIILNRDVHFKQISGVLGISMDQIKDLNPQYRRDLINGSSQPSSLRLPTSLINKFIDKEDSIFNYNPEDLELLNKRTEVEVNTETPSYTDSPRKSYRHRSYSRNRYKSRKKKQAPSKHVTIKDGDTLSEIAERNHTTIKKLKKLNGISGNSIRAGKKLKVK